jgi:hypothetical protein
MSEKLELEVIRELLPDKKKKKVTQEVVDTINKLVSDPDYGEELAENYVNFIGVMREKHRFSLEQYQRAVMFYTLIESGVAQIHAYMQVFPDRVAYRKKLYPERTVTEDLMHESSRFNRSMLVMEIRKLDTISVKLIHRSLLHEAVLKQATLMRTAKSELVQQKASETLIRELKPEEDTTINLNLGDGTSKVLQELRAATQALAHEQFARITKGTPVKMIAESKIVQGEIVE